MTSTVLTALLLAISLLGPVVAYAGVSVVWPGSDKTLDVNNNPPIKFDTTSDTDYNLARSNNFAANFTGSNGNASYTVNVSGLSGGNVTIDKFVNVSVLSNVNEFNVEIAQALNTGGAGEFELANITTFQIKLWNGTTTPAGDDNTLAPAGSEGIRCILNLKNGAGNKTSNTCDRPTEGYMWMMIVVELADNQTTEKSTVTIRPVDVTFA